MEFRLVELIQYLKVIWIILPTIVMEIAERIVVELMIQVPK